MNFPSGLACDKGVCSFRSVLQLVIGDVMFQTMGWTQGFADDILLFARFAEQLSYMLDKLVTSLGKVGFKLQCKSFDNSSATTENIDDPCWFGDCTVGAVVVP